MLKYRFFISFFSTSFLYLSLGLLFLYAQTLSVGAEEKLQEKTMIFSLANYEPEIIPEVEEKIEEVKEVIEPEVQVKEPIPIPIIPDLKPKAKPLAKVIKKEKRKKKKVQKKRKVQKRSFSKKSNSSAKKNLFLAKIRKKINRYKSYPRIAQRRGMQGKIKVKFTILSSGRVANIRMIGKKVFYGSVRNAIKKSFPIDASKAPISLPKEVNIILHYKIK